MRYIDILKEAKKFNGKANNALYDIVVKHTDCGPFDGGCLLYATALQQVFGGEIQVLVYNNIAHHAVLFVDGKYMDGNGTSSSTGLSIKKFIAYECFGKPEQMFFRVIKDGDLPDAPCPKAGVEELVIAMKTIMHK